MARQLILNKKERRQGPRLREAACLNILVIDASKTGDRVLDTKESKDFKKWLRDVGSDISFPTLSHGQGEVEMFRDLERAEKENCPWRLPNLPDRELQATIGEIKIMNPDELGCKTPADFENEITKTLRDRAVDNGDWHIVHYIGHSVAAKAESGKSGFLMLPGGIRVTPVQSRNYFQRFPKRAPDLCISAAANSAHPKSHLQQRSAGCRPLWGSVGKWVTKARLSSRRYFITRCFVNGLQWMRLSGMRVAKPIFAPKAATRHGCLRYSPVTVTSGTAVGANVCADAGGQSNDRMGN